MRAALALAVLAACGAKRPEKLDRPEAKPRPPEVVEVTPSPFGRLLENGYGCTKPPPPTVSQADARTDLDDLEILLRRGYAGFEALGFRGVNWDKELRAMRSALGGYGEPIATEAFRTFLATRLAFTGDHTIEVTAHGDDGKPRTTSAWKHRDAYALSLVLDTQRTVVESADPQLAGAFLVDCRTGDLEPTLVGPKPTRGNIVVELSTAPPPPASCTFRLADGVEVSVNLPFHRIAVGGDDVMTVFEQKERAAPFLRLRTLDTNTHRSELADFDAAAAKNFQRPAIVLDLRRLRPGDHELTYFFQSLVPKLRAEASRTLDSEVILQGEANVLWCDPARDEGKITAAMRDLTEQLRDHREERTWMRGRVLVGVRVGGRMPTRPYPGVLVLVVDAHCAGACEAAIRHARQLPRTIVVGENTAGIGEVTEPLPYRLAGSKLWITAGRELHPDLTEEGRGVQPDFWIDSAKADDVLDAIARCAVDASCARDIVVNR